MKSTPTVPGGCVVTDRNTGAAAAREGDDDADAQTPSSLRTRAIAEERQAFRDWEMSDGPMLVPILGEGLALAILHQDSQANEEDAVAAAAVEASELRQVFDEQNEQELLEVFDF